MKRSDFYKGMIGAGLVAAGVSSCEKVSSKREAPKNKAEYNWKMVTTWPPNFPIIGEVCHNISTWVHDMSEGQMTIKIYGGGELVPALETFEAVSIGGVEIGSSASYYWAGKIKAAQFFAAVPFGLNAQQMNTWLHGSGGMELWRALYEPYNLIPFNGGNTGFQMGGWYNREMNTIDDFKGLKMRIPGLGGRVLKKVGGTPILSPGSEIYTNLERGVIDATEWLGPYHDSMMGFPDIAEYYYYPGWHECGTTLELIVNRDKFNALPKHLQTILSSAFDRSRSWVLEQFEAKNAEALETIKQAGKVKIRPFSKEIIEELKLKTKETLEALASSDKDTAKVYEAFKIFKNKMKGWSDLSEGAYYSILQ